MPLVAFLQHTYNNFFCNSIKPLVFIKSAVEKCGSDLLFNALTSINIHVAFKKNHLFFSTLYKLVSENYEQCSSLAKRKIRDVLLVNKFNAFLSQLFLPESKPELFFIKYKR